MLHAAVRAPEGAAASGIAAGVDQTHASHQRASPAAVRAPTQRTPSAWRQTPGQILGHPCIGPMRCCRPSCWAAKAGTRSSRGPPSPAPLVVYLGEGVSASSAIAAVLVPLCFSSFLAPVLLCSFGARWGMPFSCFAWHVEEQDLHSLNYGWHLGGAHADDQLKCEVHVDDQLKCGVPRSPSRT